MSFDFKKIKNDLVIKAMQCDRKARPISWYPGAGQTFKTTQVCSEKEDKTFYGATLLNPVKVLLVDDDESLRETLVTALTVKGFQVEIAENGESAKSKLSASPFELVISDIQMKPGNGIELLRFVKESRPTIRFILMTGFSDICEAKDAYLLGADHFLAKPFTFKELIDAATEAISPKKIEDGTSDEDFSGISIEDFITGTEIKYNIFVRLSEAKYVKIAHKGDNIPIERIHAYKSKGVSKLYLAKNDFQRYVGLNLAISKVIDTDKTISKRRKLEFMKRTTELLLDQINLNYVEQEYFKYANEAVLTTLSMLTDSDSYMNLLQVLTSGGDYLYAHSLGVSLYGVIAAKNLKWSSPQIVSKVAMAGLFHDVGMKGLNQAIVNKPRFELSFEETNELERHTKLGLDLLSQIPSVPHEVLQVVAQHHETCAGTGYPSKLRRAKIHPYAKLIAVIDEFCHLALHTPDGRGLEAKDAVSRMTVLRGTILDSSCVDALISSFKPNAIVN